MSATTSTATATSVSIAPAAPAGSSRRARVALHTLQVVLGLFYAVASGLPKVIAHPSAAEGFDEIGWGDWFMYLIGGLEVAGGIALFTVLLSGVASIAFMGLMVGAFIVNITMMGAEYAATPLILLVPLGLIAYARRQDTARLMRLLVRRF